MSVRPEQPLVLVIFGITGDLAQRKILPALYNLIQNGELSAELRIVGISRRAVSAAQVYAKLHEFMSGIPIDSAITDVLVERTEMVQMDLVGKQAYTDLLVTLQHIEEKLSAGVVRLYYLSIPPQLFTPIVRLLGETGHNASLPDLNDAPRLLVEKPFAYDYASAQELIDVVDEHFGEGQIYRIDHYIAKETVQNILTFRFQNPLFDSVWDNKHISDISIVAREKIGIEGRATFYEQTGALRDLIQSHLLQLLAIITMAKPNKLASDEIHAEKLTLLQAVKPIPPNNVNEQTQRGQYTGYRDETGNPNSYVETFARIKLEIDNDHWRGVPITLEAGKALAEKITEITVCFSQGIEEDRQQNRLIFRIQPDEGITLLLQVKRPGVDNHTEVAKMNFNYQSAFSERQAEAYERVLVDAIKGDQTLFASAAEVLVSWQIIENVISEWAKNDSSLAMYEQGSSGLADSLSPHSH